MPSSVLSDSTGAGALSGKESIWILSQYGFETDEKYVISTGIYTQSDSAS